MYKIRRADGLFSTGGGRPKWTNAGKIWGHLGHITNHLRRAEPKAYNGTEEIIEYTLVVRSVISVDEHMEERDAVKEKQKAKEAARNAKEELERLTKRKATLQAELNALAGQIGKVDI